jgi:predicted Zn-dependent peptidase
MILLLPLITGVYHGSKDENPEDRFCPLFEHLLFEGTENIKGEWFKIVTSNGGQYHNTSDDRTYYYGIPFSRI